MELSQNWKETDNCFFFNKVNDTEALYAKYSDLIKSQYNYNFYLQKSFLEDTEKKYCTVPSQYVSLCSIQKFHEFVYSYRDETFQRHNCTKIYYRNGLLEDYRNYDKSARFLTVLILSIFILLCYCGLIFAAFMLSKESS